MLTPWGGEFGDYRALGGMRIPRRATVYWELDQGRFDSLWPLTEGRRVAKRRYEVPHEGLTIEIDVFEGPLSGIVTAEVEFDSEEASAAFEQLEWLGREVTGDPKYANESLATRGAPEGDAT